MGSQKNDRRNWCRFYGQISYTHVSQRSCNVIEDGLMTRLSDCKDDTSCVYRVNLARFRG